MWRVQCRLQEKRALSTEDIRDYAVSVCLCVTLPVCRCLCLPLSAVCLSLSLCVSVSSFSNWLVVIKLPNSNTTVWSSQTSMKSLHLQFEVWNYLNLAKFKKISGLAQFSPNTVQSFHTTSEWKTLTFHWAIKEKSLILVSYSSMLVAFLCTSKETGSFKDWHSKSNVIMRHRNNKLLLRMGIPQTS